MHASKRNCVRSTVCGVVVHTFKKHSRYATAGVQQQVCACIRHPCQQILGSSHVAPASPAPPATLLLLLLLSLVG